MRPVGTDHEEYAMSEKEAVETTEEQTEQERYDALSGNEKMNHLLRGSPPRLTDR